MIPLGTPHNFGDQKPVSPSVASGASSSHNSQEKMHLENRLRIKKLEKKEEERRVLDLEREMTHLESEIEHSRQQVRRAEGEARGVLMGARREEDLTKEAEQGVREKDDELRLKREKEEKIKREITFLKQEIETKEHALGLLHEEERHLVKEKEDFRRQFEMEHFGAKAGGEHAHEKELEATRFKQEMERKVQELTRKKGERDHTKQEILRKEDEIRTIESAIRQLC